MKLFYFIIVWASAVICILPNAAATPDDALFGSRSYAMGGASRALAASNDALLTNPAAIGVIRGYSSIDLLYSFTNINNLGRFGINVVDAKAGPVAGGFAVTNIRGSGNKYNYFTLGAAYPVIPNLSLGISVHHIRGTYHAMNEDPQSVKLYSGDIGICAVLGPYMKIGAVYNNLAKDQNDSILPATIGLGTSIAAEAFTLAADMVMLAKNEKDKSYHVGTEYIVANNIPLRLGWTYRRYQRANDKNPYEHLISGGFAWLSQNGSLEASCRRSLARDNNWGCLVAMKLGF
ncbi:MAG: hypothetical protein JW841_00360 [Deltaproteobacteria bacterium]|nr:hypothetical protein [Deltaproteobacteria bacterium]